MRFLYFKGGMALLVGMLVLLISSGLHAQPFQGGIIGGVNASQMMGDGLAGFNKFGLYGGVKARLFLTEQISADLELVYSQKGARPSPEDPNRNVMGVYMDYIDIPIVFNYHINDHLFAGIGPSVGPLVRFDRDIGWTQSQEDYHAFDFNGILNVGYTPGTHWSFDLRFHQSFYPVFINPRTREMQWHNVITLRATYMFMGVDEE